MYGRNVLWIDFVAFFQAVIRLFGCGESVYLYSIRGAAGEQRCFSEFQCKKLHWFALISLSCFTRHRSSALFSVFESCLNRSVLIRVIRSNLPQIECESMAWVSSGVRFRTLFSGFPVRVYLLRRLRFAKLVSLFV